MAVLESRLAGHGKKPGPAAGHAVRARELGPEELPKVTLRPPTPKLTPAPAPAPPQAETEEEVLVVERDEPVEEEDPPPLKPGQKRIVLRLQGEPTGAGPVNNPGGPVLPLGKYAPLKEPEQSTHHPSPKTPAKVERPTAGAEGLYQTAMEHFEQGRHALALTWFARVEKEYPAHVLVANAIFWQGECHFQSARYPLAISMYQRMIDAYPKSPKVYDAMYKLGVAQDKNGSTARARELLSRVMELVPQTPTAAKAAAYLQKMR
jgi:tol-pal system protein YbgF